jgi:phosphohistidine phosphatase SixA
LSEVPAPSLILVRHADAGDREAFVGEDLTRPLSAEGRRQAALIAERLAAMPFAHLLSSPAIRCTETLEPLAAMTGLELVVCDALVEGADPNAALAELLELSPRRGAVVVACSHGDVLGSIIEGLVTQEVPHKGRPRLPKCASVEVSLGEDGTPVFLRFRAAP